MRISEMDIMEDNRFEVKVSYSEKKFRNYFVKFMVWNNSEV